MALYQLPDPVQPRAAAPQTLITDLRGCPIPRAGPSRPHPARLAGRAVRALRSPRGQQWAHREPQPEDQEHQADRPRLPQLRPLPTATIAQPRPNPRRSLTDTDQNPPSQVRCDASQRGCRHQLSRDRPPHARAWRWSDHAPRAFAPQCPIHRAAPYPESFGDLGDGEFPLVVHPPGRLGLVRGHHGRSAPVAAPGPRGGAAGSGSLADQLPLELGERTQHTKDQSAAERARATRQRIVAAATKLFVRDGYLQTTMADIAREAGVAVQTLYCPSAARWRS